MKRALIIFVQFILMLIAFFVGGILPVFHILPLWSIATSPTSLFVLDGLYLAIILYMLFVVVGALRRRFPLAAINSTVAFALAIIIGVLARFPFRSA
jgi:hypothetical protein